MKTNVPHPAGLGGGSPREDDADLLEDEVEAAIDDKREGVIAADATGMVGNEVAIRVAEFNEGEVTPPV